MPAILMEIHQKPTFTLVRRIFFSSILYEFMYIESSCSFQSNKREILGFVWKSQFRKQMKNFF